MRELKIIVCIKQIPDPEGPRSSYKIDVIEKKIIPVGIPPVINPYDENALESALQLKDKLGVKIIVVNMTERAALPILRKALSVGGDELVVLEDEKFKDLNSYSTAYVLSTAIKKIGEYDIILVGRQAADWDCGQTGLIIAEILEIPSINLAQKVRVEDSWIIVERLKRNGYEVVKARKPILITVSSEIGDLRLPSLKAIKEANQKLLTVWNIVDLKIDPKNLETRKIYKLYSPPATLRKCIWIEGQSPQEKGEKLAVKLKEEGII